MVPRRRFQFREDEMRRRAMWITGALVWAGVIPYLTGCATVLRGTGHGIGISSQPAGAEVVVDNKVVGVTPVSAKLRRKDNHHVTIRLEGYESFEVVLTRQTSAWILGNLVFGLGAPIGILIDAAAGGMYTLKPGQIEATLQPGAAKTSVADGNLYVVLVKDVGPDWQKIGQLKPVF